MKVSATGQVSRGFRLEFARHLARLCDVPDGGSGIIGARGRGGPFSLLARGELVVVWCDWTSRAELVPRGELAFDWGCAARWRDARELAHAVLARRCREVYATRYVEPILCDEFARPGALWADAAFARALAVVG